MIEDNENEQANKPPWAEDNETSVAEKPIEKTKEEKREDVKASSIINQVFEKLGRPKNMFRYSVVNVYGNRYRVNIMLNDGTIPDSFFVHISSGGEIVYANPEIVRKY